MKEDAKRFGSIVLSLSAVMGLSLLLGRLSGLYRELEFAKTFGISKTSDIAILILTTPDLLVNLFLTGGLAAVLVPRLRQISSDQRDELVGQIFVLVIFVFSLISVVIYVFPNQFFSILAPGLPEESIPEKLVILAICMSIPLLACSGVLIAYLHARKVFFMAGVSAIIFNLSVVGWLYLGRQFNWDLLIVLGLGILIGSLLRLTANILLASLRWAYRIVHFDSIDGNLVRGFVSALGTSSLLVCIPIITRSFGSIIGEGSISALTYSSKIVEFPVAVMVTAIATVSLTRLSTLYDKNDFSNAERELRASLRHALCNGFAACLILFYFSFPIVDVLLGYGAMDSNSVSRISDLLQISVAATPFIAVSSVLRSNLNAQNKPNLIFRATSSCLVALLILCLVSSLLGSERLVAISVVIFHILYALVLWIQNTKDGQFEIGLFSKKYCERVFGVSMALGLVFLLDRIFVKGSTHESAVQVFMVALLLGIIVIWPRSFISADAKNASQ